MAPVEHDLQCVARAQSIAEYAMSAPERPALSFGYGVIGAGEIPPALSRLRHALLGGA